MHYAAEWDQQPKKKEQSANVRLVELQVNKQEKNTFIDAYIYPWRLLETSLVLSTMHNYHGTSLEIWMD